MQKDLKRARDQSQQASEQRKLVRRAEETHINMLFEKYQTAESHIEVFGKFVKQKTQVEKTIEKREKPLREIQQHALRTVKQAEKDVKQLTVSLSMCKLKITSCFRKPSNPCQMLTTN